MNPTQSPTSPHAAGKAAHTDTPFHVGQISGRLQAVYGQLGEQVADCSGCLPHQESNANAAFIVRACNSHEALLAFAKTFALWDSKGIIKTLAPYEGNEGGLRELARAALQSANLEAAQ